MSATADTLISYYEALLISQYFNKPKAIGTIGALVGGTGKYGVLADAIYNQVRDGFDLDTAVGRQLDIIGKFRGITRYLNTLNLAKVFLPLVSYDDGAAGTLPGIATYEDIPLPPSIYTMTYEDFVTGTLNDGDFRRVIKFLAAVESCDYAYETLDSICYTFFIGNVNIKVTAAMAITYQHLTSDTDNLFTIISQMGLLPTPAGVAITVDEVSNF